MLPEPLEGPYPSIEAYCDKRVAAAEANEGGGETIKCACPESPNAAPVIGSLGSSFGAAKIFATICRGVGNESRVSAIHLTLALPGPHGWYTQEGVTLTRNELFEATGIAKRDAGDELLWTTEVSTYQSMGTRWRREVIVLGVGASGTPSATPPMLLAERIFEPGERSADRSPVEDRPGLDRGWTARAQGRTERGIGRTASAGVSVRLPLVAIATLGALAGLASAQATPKLDTCLAGGRKLEDQGLHADAVTAFQACMRIAPDDAMVESEIGWSAFLAHDLDLAETSSRAAIRHALVPNPKASGFYNLGRIAEERKDLPRAIQAYIDSLGTRQSSAVRERLRALDPAAAARLEPFRPKPLDGPYPSIAAYCKKRVAADELDNETAKRRKEFVDQAQGDPDQIARAKTLYGCRCATSDGDAGGKMTIGKLGPGWEHTTIFASECVGDTTDKVVSTVNLALKTAAGWYFLRGVSVVVNGHETDSVSDSSLAKRNAGPELLWTVHHAGDFRGERQWDRRVLVVIGAGASGTPSATPPIEIQSRESQTSGDGIEKVTSEHKLEADWTADGQLVLKGSCAVDGVAGAHTLIFP